MMEILAEGWWCEGCETFEMEDDIDETKDFCFSCGCAGSQHRPVEILTKGFSQ